MMITISRQRFQELPKLLEERRRQIIARISRLDNIEPTEDFAFHYSILRCSLDVVEFMMHYLCPKESAPPRNHVCHATAERPLTYDKFKDVVAQSIGHLLKKDPTSNQRFNSNLFITLHFIDKIKFED